MTKKSSGTHRPVAKVSRGRRGVCASGAVANISQTMVALQRSGVWVVGIDQTGEISYNRVDVKLSTGDGNRWQGQRVSRQPCLLYNGDVAISVIP